MEESSAGSSELNTILGDAKDTLARARRMAYLAKHSRVVDGRQMLTTPTGETVDVTDEIAGMVESVVSESEALVPRLFSFLDGLMVSARNFSTGDSPAAPGRPPPRC